jgi:hypothetical protein
VAAPAGSTPETDDGAFMEQLERLERLIYATSRDQELLLPPLDGYKAALEGWDVQGQAEDADVTLLGFSVRVHDVPLKGTDPGGGAGSGAVRRRMPGHRRPSSGSFEGVKVPIRA